MRSGMMVCSAPCSLATPWTRIVEVPAPSIFAPIFDQQSGEIGHFRLARRVLDHGFAAGQHGRHQKVFGAGDGDAVELNIRALQTVGSFGFNIAVLLADFRAQSLEPGDVQIDGTRADGAAAWQRYAGACRTARPAVPAPGSRLAWS